MRNIFGEPLVFRLSALVVLLICLVLVSQGGTPLQEVSEVGTPLQQVSPKPATQQPKILAETQPDSPLAITSIQFTGDDSPDLPNREFGFHVVNVSSKPIAAFAIRQEVSIDGAKSGGGVSLYHPLLSSSPLSAGRSILIPDTADSSVGNNGVINLSVDFVQFADGTRWGSDSGQSSERVSGQRAAAEILSEKLLKTLNTETDVLRQIEDSAGNIPHPQDRSEAWKAGFNSALRMLVDRLKRANEKGGTRQVKSDLRSLNETLKPKE